MKLLIAVITLLVAYVACEYDTIPSAEEHSDTMTQDWPSPGTKNAFHGHFYELPKWRKSAKVKNTLLARKKHVHKRKARHSLWGRRRARVIKRKGLRKGNARHSLWGRRRARVIKRKGGGAKKTLLSTKKHVHKHKARHSLWGRHRARSSGKKKRNKKGKKKGGKKAVLRKIKFSWNNAIKKARKTAGKWLKRGKSKVAKKPSHKHKPHVGSMFGSRRRGGDLPPYVKPGRMSPSQRRRFIKHRSHLHHHLKKSKKKFLISTGMKDKKGSRFKKIKKTQKKAGLRKTHSFLKKVIQKAGKKVGKWMKTHKSKGHVKSKLAKKHFQKHKPHVSVLESRRRGSHLPPHVKPIKKVIQKANHKVGKWLRIMNKQFIKHRSHLHHYLEKSKKKFLISTGMKDKKGSQKKAGKKTGKKTGRRRGKRKGRKTGKKTGKKAGWRKIHFSWKKVIKKAGKKASWLRGMKKFNSGFSKRFKSGFSKKFKVILKRIKTMAKRKAATIKEMRATKRKAALAKMNKFYVSLWNKLKSAAKKFKKKKTKTSRKLMLRGVWKKIKKKVGSFWNHLKKKVTPKKGQKMIATKKLVSKKTATDTEHSEEKAKKEKKAADHLFKALYGGLKDKVLKQKSPKQILERLIGIRVMKSLSK